MAKLNTTARLMLGSAALALSWCPLAKAAAELPIQKGEKVQVNYVCRLDNGALAAATYRDAALKPEEKRSNIFLALKNDAPEQIVAGPNPVNPNASAPFDFADAITAKLSIAAVGLAPGLKHSISIAAKDLPTRSGATIQLARIRRRPKELRITVEDFENRTGKAPEVGQELTFDPAVPGEVASIEGQKVLIRFKAPVGEHIETPFGQALVKANEHSYLLEIEAKKGALIRSGPMVGRIIDVKEKTFVVDYSHPLAGESLHCDVMVERKNDSAAEEQKS